jgi:hypothetical protein
VDSDFSPEGKLFRVCSKKHVKGGGNKEHFKRDEQRLENCKVDHQQQEEQRARQCLQARKKV